MAATTTTESSVVEGATLSTGHSTFSSDTSMSTSFNALIGLIRNPSWVALLISTIVRAGDGAPGEVVVTFTIPILIISNETMKPRASRIQEVNTVKSYPTIARSYRRNQVRKELEANCSVNFAFVRIDTAFREKVIVMRAENIVNTSKDSIERRKQIDVALKRTPRKYESPRTMNPRFAISRERRIRIRLNTNWYCDVEVMEEGVGTRHIMIRAKTRLKTQIDELVVRNSLESNELLVF